MKGNNLNNKNFKGIGLYLLLGIILISILTSFLESPQDKSGVIKLSYSEFLSNLEHNRVKKVIITQDTILGFFEDGNKFTTYIPNDPDLMKLLKQKEVDIEVRPPVESPWWLRFLTSIFPTLLFIGFWIIWFQQMQGGGGKVMSFAKSKAKLVSGDKKKVTFKDVAGIDEAKEEVAEIVEFLKNPHKFIRLGAKIPKGILLYGPPGSGKTLLARAIAGEADVPFFSISGSDFVEMFVGVGAARVRDLFEQAKKNAPCIVFIDEIDAVGRQRGAGLGGGHDEREQTLNQLLVEMDGFDQSKGIILIAATNRPDVLDPALLRPGRFDRHIVVDRPDIVGREEILKIHVRGKPIAEDVDLKVLARRTPGFVGSDLANLVNEAAILASRKNKTKIEMEDFEEAIDRVIAGPERKSKVISEKEKKIIAFHEAGHALVAKMLPNTDPVHKVSIIPRGMGALGYTLQLPTEDKYIVTKSELLEKLSVLLGGRVAEEFEFSEMSTGAQNDLERATNIAREMVTRYGMSSLGPITLGKKHEQVFLGRDIAEDRNYSDAIAFKIDQEIKNIIEDAYKRAREIIEKNSGKLKKIAEKLLEKEVLEGKELDDIIGDQEALSFA